MTTYVLDTGYPLTTQGFEDLLSFSDKVEEVTGRDSVSSGGGFGIRDAQYEFDTFDEAKEAADAVSKLFEKEFGPQETIGYFEANPDLPHYNWYVGVYEEDNEEDTD